MERETPLMVVVGCLITPSDRVLEAPGLIQAAIKAIGRHDLDTARQRVMDVDRRALWGYWFRAGVEWAALHQPAIHASGLRRQAQPNAAIKRSVFDRDGWRCRYCGLRVIHPESLKLLSRVIPAELPCGGRNGNSHPATIVLAATPDHVDPRSRGGSHDAENLVTSCGTCQYQAKGACTLAELGLADPRDTAPVLDAWDGLIGLDRAIDHNRSDGDGDEIPRFDPELEYLIAAARAGHYLPAVKDRVLLDKLATIFEDALPQRHDLRP